MNKYIKSIFIIVPALFSAIACNSNTQTDKDYFTKISPGVNRTEAYLPLLEGKKVGMVVNKTSMVNNTHLVDTFIGLKLNVAKIFAPEHGFRGNKSAGETINDEIDAKTGLPIISLYGKSKKPSGTMLQGIDIMVFDIQDVGARFYTYVSTMHYVMEACAENNIPLIIFDRPNPNGDYIDGPVLDTAFRSFVGMHPVPVVHGLTVGELALMINGEGWLANGVKCKLMVVKVKNYTHKSPYVLPIPPSPNLPDSLAIRLYPSLCFFEGTAISVARGTTFPFKAIGFPDETFGPFAFAPVSIPGVADNPPQMGKICFGHDFRNDTNLPAGFNINYLVYFRQKFTDFSQFMTNPKFFNLLAGNDILIRQLEEGLSAEAIRKSWEPKLSAYKIMRKKYLLYAE